MLPPLVSVTEFRFRCATSRAESLVEGDELAAFDEGGRVGAGGGGVVLGGHEEPLATDDAIIDDRGDVDDAGVLFVERLEVDGARGKAGAIGFKDLHGAGLALSLGAKGVVDDPVLGDIGAITRVFLNVEFVVVADGQVVEATGLRRRLDPVMFFESTMTLMEPPVVRMPSDVRAIEVELVDLGGDGYAVNRRTRGGEDQGILVDPMSVFRASELGYAGGAARRSGTRLRSCAAMVPLVEDRGEGEGAVDAGGVLERDGAGIARDAGQFTLTP